MKLFLINIIFQEGGDFWIENSFKIEQFLILIVLAGQLYFFIMALIDTYLLRRIFNDTFKVIKVKVDKHSLNIIEPTKVDANVDLDEEDTLFNQKQIDHIVEISLLETSGNNDIILRIKNMINTYLINNYGAAVNFSIIKDIIDREVDVKDDEISQSLPTPLYLGLAATMLGIIFGFMAMPDINDDGSNFTAGINSLIEGVKYAMGASLAGLVLTTILSSGFYKGAKRKSLKDKNDQLSFLQAELLPELIKAEDTGVSGLKASLDRFARVATDISDNVLIASNQTGENLILQQEMMDKFEQMDMIKISNANLDLFAKLDDNMKSFKKFSTYLKAMEGISKNLKDFASRTVAVDAIAAQISTSLEDSKKLSEYLTTHLEKIESSGNHALNAVNYADSHFRTAIEKLEKEISERINKINTSAISHESSLKGIYEEIGNSLNKVTSDHIKEFTKSYAGAVPQFEQLENLKELVPIKSVIESKADLLKREGSNYNENLIRKISDINDSINQLRRDFNNVSATLEPVYSSPKSSQKNNIKSGSKELKIIKKKPGFFKRVGNLFRFSKNGKQRSKSKKVKEELNDSEN